MSSFSWHQIYSGWSKITAHGSKESDPKNGVVYKFHWMTQYIQFVYQRLLNLVIPYFLDWSMFLRNEWTNWKHGSLYFSNAMQDSCITRAVIMPILRWAAGGQTNQEAKTNFVWPAAHRPIGEDNNTSRRLFNIVLKLLLLANPRSKSIFSFCDEFQAGWTFLPRPRIQFLVTWNCTNDILATMHVYIKR